MNHYQPLRGQNLCYLKVPNRQRIDAPTASPTAAAPTAAPAVRPGLIDPDAELAGFGAAERGGGGARRGRAFGGRLPSLSAYG